MSLRKTIYKLCKHIPGPHLRTMLCSYFKNTDLVPEIAPEMWAMLKENYRFIKTHGGKYKIVSLGCDCMARSFTTAWLLKPCKAAGEKGMPFDLACSPPETVAHFLENDFADYFADGWSYDEKYKRWKNSPGTGMWYPHDKDCAPDAEGLAKLQKRLQGRIENFREVMNYPDLIMFTLHKKADGKPEDIQRICRKLTELRQGKPTKFLIMACDTDESCREIEGTEFRYVPYPSMEYHWYDPKMRFSVIGIRHEMKFVTVCREVLCRELGIAEPGK